MSSHDDGNYGLLSPTFRRHLLIFLLREPFWTLTQHALSKLWWMAAKSRGTTYSFPKYSVSYCIRNGAVSPPPYSFLNVLKPTGHVMHQQFDIQQLYALPHTVFMCFVFIREQTATCATYSLNWLVFITEMKSVYCAVRTGSLNKTVWSSSLKV